MTTPSCSAAFHLKNWFAKWGTQCGVGVKLLGTKKAELSDLCPACLRLSSAESVKKFLKTLGFRECPVVSLLQHHVPSPCPGEGGPQVGASALLSLSLRSLRTIKVAIHPEFARAVWF